MFLIRYFKNIGFIFASLYLLGTLYVLGTVTPVSAATAVPDANANIPRVEPTRPLPQVPANIERQEKPAYQPDASDKKIKLVIQTFTFSGNQSFSTETLNALLRDYEKREIGLQELNQAAKVITDFYRARGFFLAQAYLPAQDINENSVEIAILEGKLDALTLTGVESLNGGFLKQMATYHLQPGGAIGEHNLVRNVTLLNSLPAVTTSAQLNPGDAVGSTNIEINFEPLPRWQAYMAANTYGNRFTGREVLLAGVVLNNPAGVGDQLSLNLKRSKNDGQRGLQVSYYTPIHASGTLLSLGYNYIDYKLGGTFEALKASGDSQYFNVGLDQTIMRDSQKGLSVRVGGVYKRINDEVSAFSLENRRNISAIDLGLFGDWFNAAGDASHQLGINIRVGRVSFKDDFAKILDKTGAKTAGSFIKYSLNATRVQYLDTGVSITLRADVQGTNKNLDSVEKFALGGINRWRAFSELPSLADAGFMVGAEVRKKIVANKSLASLLLEGVSPYGFIDVGRGKINQRPSSDDNHVESIHYGLGLDLAFKRDWLLSMAVSHQNRDFEGANAENETRIWGQLQKAF